MKDTIHAPEPKDLFPDKTESEKRGRMKLASSDIITEKCSDFQAYAWKVGHTAEVQWAYNKVRELHPAATHIVGVYNLKNSYGAQDDDEHSSSSKLYAVIKGQGLTNMAVFITRYYGGVKLGPYTHKLIKDAALQAIDCIGK